MPCAKCGKEDADKKCGRCFVTVYCSRECQRDHWKTHKKICSQLANENRSNNGGNGKSAADDSEATSQTHSVRATDLTSAATQIAQVLPNTSNVANETAAPVTASVANTDVSAAADAPSSGTPNGMQKITIPSRAYVPPSNLSAKGRAAYEKVKPILDNTIDQLHQTIVDTEFCEATDENTRKIDIRILATLFELLGETMRADPNSAAEVFKRFLSIKNMTKRPDDPAVASWASLLGQQGLVRAQEIKMDAIRKAPKPPPGQSTIHLGQEVAQQMHFCRMDALVFLLMSNQFLEAAVTSKPETLGSMEQATAYRLYNLARVALGFAFRHTQDNSNQRTNLWTAIATDESAYQADPLLKGLATYGLAFDACKAGDVAAFDRLVKRSREHWSALNDKAMVGFTTRNLERGVCPQCVQEMTGIMDGCEMRFKQFIETHIAMQEKLAAAALSSAGKAAGSNGAGSSKGARLIPGGADDSDDKPAAKPASGLRVASSMQQAQAGIQGLRDEMKRGYQLYDDQQMEAGVEHFGRLLKRAFDLPLSGMSISLMFSLSHAHIEGAAQLRRWGKAEDTISKLKEIAEFASENKIPNAIESIADRLHLWWREKRANIYSRQRKFDKAVKTLEGAVEHAEALSQRSEAGIMILLTSAHVECFLSGSPQADLGALQGFLDRGIAALRADPPPVGGAKGANGQTPAQQWAGDTKLETWIKLVPMLRALEGEGLDIEAAEATLLPLADKFDLQVGQTVFNAEQYVQTAMREDRKLLGGRGGRGISGTTVLFGVAVLLPVLLMLWLTYYALTAPDDVEDADFEFDGADGPGPEL